MKKYKNRQKVKELLREFLKNLRGLLVPKIEDLSFEEFMRIESKHTRYKMKGCNEKYFG